MQTTTSYKKLDARSIEVTVQTTLDAQECLSIDLLKITAASVDRAMREASTDLCVEIRYRVVANGDAELPDDVEVREYFKYEGFFSKHAGELVCRQIMVVTCKSHPLPDNLSP